MRHVAPLSPVASVDCAYFPSPWGCTYALQIFLPPRQAQLARPLFPYSLAPICEGYKPLFPQLLSLHIHTKPPEWGPCSGGSRFLLLATRHSALATRIGSGALQDGAQLADVLKTFDGQDFLDQSCGGGSTKNGPDQVAGFSDDFVAGHGIFRGAAYVLYPFA